MLTDISTLNNIVGEPDDTQSMIRLLLYANEFKIEGIAATYTSHNKTIYPDYIREIIKAYGKSWKNLKRYGNFPSDKYLLKRVFSGNKSIGVNQIGEGKDTEASERIIELLKNNSSEPLWILIWGGQLDLAQALWKIQNTMPEDKAQNLIAAARVYAIADQYDECGPWIRSNFKDLFYIVNQVSFRGMYRGGDSTLVSKDWVDKNIKSNPAPLAQLYPNYKGGDPWGKVTGIKEGDSPSVLYLLNGNPEKPMSGCWGGTFSLIEGTNHYTDGKKSDFPLHTESVYKWRSDFQSDFLKRLAWLNK